MQINWIVAGLGLLCATGLQADDSVSIKHEIPVVQTLPAHDGGLPFEVYQKKAGASAIAKNLPVGTE